MPDVSTPGPGSQTIPGRRPEYDRARQHPGTDPQPDEIAIAGASGRMGQMLIEATLAQHDLTLAAALDRPGQSVLGRDCAETLGRSTGVRVASDLATLAGSDVLIDFTRPEATLAHLDACVAAGVKMVIGTTGFDDAGKSAIRAAGRGDRDRLCAEHERRRQRHLQAGRDRHPHAQ